MANCSASPRDSGYSDGPQIQSWEILYEAALCEFDRELLREKLQAALIAIEKRLLQLPDSETRERLQCLSAHQTLKTLARLELNAAA